VRGLYSAVDAVFMVKATDPGHLLPVVFDNFVWWSPEEITAAVHQQLPLFDGRLVDQADQEDALVAVLKDLVAAKQPGASVAQYVTEPGIGRLGRTLHVTITKPAIVLTAINLEGVSPAMAPAVNKLTAQLSGKRYSEGTLDQLLTPYRNAGYLDAKLTEVNREVVPDADRVGVRVTAKVVEGEPYRVAGLEWPGSPVVSTAQFDAATKLHAGDVASQDLLWKSMAILDSGYRQQGYMDIGIGAVAKTDPATHLVSYTVTIAQGEQYRVKTLNVIGLGDAQHKEFDPAWKMVPGTLYNPIYASGFLKNNTALLSLYGYSAGFTAKADPDTHTVDLTVKFVRGAAATQ
jgi:outer membrane protein insertion porin family